MLRLPEDIAANYRPASDREIHSWSFGAMRRERVAGDDWQQQRGTLLDQAIFGPRTDYECACGKYRASRHKSMICDRCGVKVAPRSVRRQRFGHIDLPAGIVHPLSDAHELHSVPVLPAAVWESTAGEGLPALYEVILQACHAGRVEQAAGAYTRVAELLMPVFVATCRWDLADAPLLGQGLALVRSQGDDLLDQLFSGDEPHAAKS
jgi:hypothetical protein